MAFIAPEDQASLAPAPAPTKSGFVASETAATPVDAVEKAKAYRATVGEILAAPPELQSQIQKERGVTLPASEEEYKRNTLPLFRLPAGKRLFGGAAEGIAGDANPGDGAVASAVAPVLGKTAGNVIGNIGNAVGGFAADTYGKLEQAGSEIADRARQPAPADEYDPFGEAGAARVVGPVLGNLAIGGAKAVGGLLGMGANATQKAGNLIQDLRRGTPEENEKRANEEAAQEWSKLQAQRKYIAPAEHALTEAGGMPGVQGVGELAGGLVLPVPISLKAGEKGAVLGKSVAEAIPTATEALAGGAGRVIQGAGIVADKAGPLVLGHAPGIGPFYKAARKIAGGGADEAGLLTRAGQGLREAAEGIPASGSVRATAAEAGQVAGVLGAAGLSTAEGAALGAASAPTGQEAEGARGMMGMTGAFAPLAMVGAARGRRANELEGVRQQYADLGARQSYGEALDAANARGTAGLAPELQREVDVARGVLGSVSPEGQARRVVVLTPEEFATQAQGGVGQVGIEAANARGFFSGDDGTVYLNRGQIRGVDSIQEVIAHEGAHGLFDAFERQHPEQAAPIRQAVMDQAVTADGKPTEYLRKFVRNYGGDEAALDGPNATKAANYYVDELLAQTGASLGVFANTGRFTKAPELSERVSDAISNALLRRNPNRVDLRTDTTQGAPLGVNPEARAAMREGVRTQLSEGAERAFDPRLRDAATGPRAVRPLDPLPPPEPADQPDIYRSGALRSPPAPGGGVLSILRSDGLPEPTPSSVPDSPLGPITRPLGANGRPVDAPATTNPQRFSSPLVDAPTTALPDAVAALRALKVPPREAQSLVEAAVASGSDATDTAAVVRDALRRRQGVGPLGAPVGEKSTNVDILDRPLDREVTPRKNAPSEGVPERSEKPAADVMSRSPIDPATPAGPADLGDTVSVADLRRKGAPDPSKLRADMDAAAEAATPTGTKRKAGEDDASLERRKAEKLETAKKEAQVAVVADALEQEGFSRRVSLNPETGESKASPRLSGRELDPSNPVHAAALELAGVAPERARVINDAIAGGEALSIRYGSAKADNPDLSAASRAQEQAASSVAARKTGDTTAEDNPKTFYPSSYRLVEGGKTAGDLELSGFDADKFNANAQRLLDFLGRNAPERLEGVGFDSINSAAFARAARAYAENHANGYRGDGSAPVRETPNVRTEAKPDFTPVKLPKPVSDLLNLAYGDEAAVSSAGAEGARARELARENERLPANYVFPREGNKAVLGDPNRPAREVNPLREAINSIKGEDGQPLLRAVDKKGEPVYGTRDVIESAISTLNLSLARDIASAGETAPGAAGMRRVFGGNPSSQFAGGVPRGDFARAGFLPGKRITPEQDAAYLDAAKTGDKEATARMVGEAAKAAGYSVGPVYHGTKSDFESFNPSRGGEYGSGVYFAENPDTARAFAGYASGAGPERVIPSFLRLENPLVTSDRNVPRGKGVTAMQKAGHDGVIGSDSQGVRQYVVFDPAQAKSADPITRDAKGRIIPLSQRFNPESNDIRFLPGRKPSDTPLGERDDKPRWNINRDYAPLDPRDDNRSLTPFRDIKPTDDGSLGKAKDRRAVRF